MPPFLNQLSTQLRSLWKRMDTGQRLQIGSVGLAAVVGLFAIVWFSGQPDDFVLFRADSRDELSRVTDGLDRQGVSYRLEGRTVLVPRDERDRVAQLDVPGVEFDASAELSKIDTLSSSTELQRRRMHEVQEDDLEASIRASFDSVDAVRISAASRSLRTSLASRNRRRSASVHLTLAPSTSQREFRHIATDAIARVSAEFELDPANVRVSSSNPSFGTFAEDGSMANTGATNAVEDFVRDQKRHYNELLTAILGPIPGVRGKVDLRVDTDQYEKDSTVPPSELPLIRSSRQTDSQPQASGTPGVDPSGPQLSQAQNQITTNEYADGFMIHERQRRTQPQVVGFNIWVWRAEDECPKTETELVEFVRDGFGSDSNVTVSVSVTSVPTLVDEPIEIVAPLPIEEPIVEPTPAWREYLPEAARVLSVAIVCFFLLFVLRRSTPKPKKVAPKVEIPKPIVTEKELDPMRAQRAEVERQFDRDPNTTSRVLESWMTETKV